MKKNEVIQIEVFTSGRSQFVPTLTTYIPDIENDKKPAVIIFAGGAYKVVSQYEGAPTAEEFAKRGFAAFCVHYSCMPATFPQSLCEAMWAVRYVRTHAEEYGIDPENVTAMGFSAGGHLVASLGTLWNIPSLDEYMGCEREDCLPDRLVLCYPVISNKGNHHRESFVNLLGGAGIKNQELVELTCLEEQVTSRTPPTFIWHGAADDCVPVDGSIRFFNSLLAAGVTAELHVYPFAGHGGGLNRGRYHCSWVDEAEKFIRNTRK